MKTEMIHTRVDHDIKQNAELIFSSLGINTSDAIRMFLTQVTLQQGIPFEVKIPNKVTRKAMDDVIHGRNLTKSTMEEFHKLLHD